MIRACAHTVDQRFAQVRAGTRTTIVPIIVNPKSQLNGCLWFDFSGGCGCVGGLVSRRDAAQGNVKEARYGVDFFAGFDMVLNGLDNMEARRHVNRLTLAAGTPLIESGTEGYLGQARTIASAPLAVQTRPQFLTDMCYL